jgi:hypothetical protein
MRIVDEQGAPLREVTVNSWAHKVPGWYPGTLQGWDRGQEQRSVVVDGSFSSSYRGAGINLDFHKAGFFPEHFEWRNDDFGNKQELDRVRRMGWRAQRDGYKLRLDVMLVREPPKGDVSTSTLSAAVEIGETESNVVAIPLPGSPDESQHGIVLRISGHAKGSGTEESSNFLSAELVMTNPDDGVVFVDIPERDKPIKWMRRAPEAGYAQTAAIPVPNVYGRASNYYVRIGKWYGICRISKGDSDSIRRDGDRVRVTTAFTVQIMLQPEGRDILLPR